MSTEIKDVINWKSPKFLEENRTFKTRLLFINEMFSNKFSQEDILGRCIQHKLKWSYELYEEELHKSLWNLCGEDPIEIVKQLDKIDNRR